MSVHLVLGGARSGKSTYAEKLAINSHLPVTYIATAQIYDDEFKYRVEQHQSRRPADWKLIEEPHWLIEKLIQEASKDKCLIVDCLTLWLAQWICADCNPPANSSWPLEREAFLMGLPKLSGTIILVSNEVGLGIVPLGEINRRFQDEQGRLNQSVANVADSVSFIAAGLAIKLKG